MRRFTADLHLGSKTVAAWRFGKWPGNVAKHDGTITDHWDATVADEDEMFLVGDTIGEYGFDELADWLDARPGVKHVLLGNNDELADFDWRALPVATVSHAITMPIGLSTPIPMYQMSATLNHYPDHVTTANVLIHGHTHRKEKGGWLNTPASGQVRVHVGWDGWKHFVTEDDIVNFVGQVRASAVRHG